MYRKPIGMDDWGRLDALTGIIFGIWIRILPAATTNFPINDGGLFYVMLDSLIKNGFFLPQIIEYNGLSIPFTYPPLAFYLGGWLSSGFQIPLLDLLRWMPAIVTSFTVPAFYYLAKSLLKSELEAGLATLIF